MSPIYLILFCLVICSTVSTEGTLDVTEVQRFLDEIKRMTGKRGMMVIRNVNNKPEISLILCDDEKDCKEKLGEEVQHIFMRFG
nr:Tx-1005 [Heteropoda pingtungensis]